MFCFYFNVLRYFLRQLNYLIQLLQLCLQVKNKTIAIRTFMSGSGHYKIFLITLWKQPIVAKIANARLTIPQVNTFVT
jgi:hypothetical protein